MLLKLLLLNMPECVHINRNLNMPRVLNMSSSEYGKALNVAKVLIMRALHSVLSIPEYVLIEY